MQLSSLPGGRILTNGRNEKIGFVFKKVAMVPSLLRCWFVVFFVLLASVNSWPPKVLRSNGKSTSVVHRLTWYCLDFFLSLFIFFPVMIFFFCVRNIGQLL